MSQGKVAMLFHANAVTPAGASKKSNS